MQTELVPEVEKGAVLSECGTYRYRLWRSWGSGPRVRFVMLNPSTADAEVDDPTIRRCMGFARREGFDGIEVINLYAMRATKPEALLGREDAEGPLNRHWWSHVLHNRGGPAVAAWGSSAANPRLPISYTAAFHDALMDSWLCLGKTKDGYPRHPLYVKGDQPFIPYRGQKSGDSD